jgi:dihydroorotate dehydrogenase electron transfer subunit
LVLRLPHFPATEPGQFVQVACRDLDRDYSEPVEFDWEAGIRPGEHGIELNGRLAFLRRPFSLAGRRDLTDGVELDLIHRVVGVGTDWLSNLKIGDGVFVLGPLGNRFELPKQNETAILVGGGVGIPPMIYLASKLVGKNAVVFSGALTRDLLPLTIQEDGPAPGADDATPRMNIAEFAKYGVRAVMSTDDGSYGYRGFVTQALEAYLSAGEPGRPLIAGEPGRPRPGTLDRTSDRTSDRTANRAGDGPALLKNAIIYTCGPEPMMKRVAEIAAKFSIPCQIAVERAMACGMGTCQSCCIKVKKKDAASPPNAGKDWAYRLACTDGPVFPATELLW